MRLLTYGVAVAVLTAACGSAGTAQGVPPVPQPIPVTVSPAPLTGLVGTWDAITRSYGGLGQTALFTPDGNVGLVLGAMVEFKYKLEGDKLTVYNDDPRNKFSQTSKLTLIGDTAIVSSAGKSSAGKPLKMVRLATATTGSGLVGTWQYMHYTGVPGYDEYAEDGSMRLRVPIQVQRGIYSVVGNKVSFQILTPARENWDAEFAINGDTLAFQMGGQKHLYLRARPLIPYDVQQPARPSGMVR
jgi:hypothetical protein